MKKSVFINFYEMKHGKRGQVAAFLIFVVIIILITAIAFIEVTRVNQAKLNTANAADAGALAGASQLASTANTIAEMNENMFYAYLGLLVAAALYTMVTYPTNLIETHLPFYFWVFYIPICVFDMFAYCGLLLAGKDAFYTARSATHAYAFNNAGISEAVRRKENEPVKQPFAKWLDDKTDNGDLEEKETLTYDWKEYTFEPQQGKQVKEANDNAVTSVVKMDAEAMALKPAFPMPIITIFTDPILLILDAIADAFAASILGLPIAAIIKAALLAAAVAICLAVTIGYSLFALLAFLPILLSPLALVGADPDLDQILDDLLISLFWPKVICVPFIPKPSILIVTLWVPLAYLTDIVNVDKFKVNSWVNRHLPQKNLGFWQMKAQDVSSSAKSQVFEASSSACPARGWQYQLPCYDLELRDVK